MYKLKALNTILSGEGECLPGKVYIAKTKEERDYLINAGAAEPLEEKAAGDESKKRLTAKEIVELIDGCATVEDVDGLLEGEDRKTVLDAAEKKKAALLSEAAGGKTE